MSLLEYSEEDWTKPCPSLPDWKFKFKLFISVCDKRFEILDLGKWIFNTCFWLEGIKMFYAKKGLPVKLNTRF